MTAKQCRRGASGADRVVPPPGRARPWVAERYGARDDGAGPGASAALLALRNADVVVSGTKRR
jgi:hypothetical protein